MENSNNVVWVYRVDLCPNTLGKQDKLVGMDMVNGLIRMVLALNIWLTRNRADVAVSLESIRAISDCFGNSVYGFFLGKCIAYLVVENYVKNTWSKYGLIKSMMNLANGLFFFKFNSKDGMDGMLENDPWFIHDTSLILKRWTSDANLLKEDVGNVSVWVKFHNVPITTFSEDGLSSIATKLDTIMVDVPKLVVRGFLGALYVLSMSGNLLDKLLEEFRQEVSNSNPFDVLNMVENDDDLARINNLERQILDEKLVLVDDDRKPSKKFDSPLG
ncbi:beta-caryophyllene synthase [Tanacetum coccineum]